MLALLTACGGGDGEEAAAAETTAPGETAMATPAIPEEEPVEPKAKEFMGVWIIGETPEQRFDLVVLPNGTALSTYMDGEKGVRGEFGQWQYQNDALIVSFDSGWRDVLSKQGGDYVKKSYAPDAPLEGEANNTSLAKEYFGPKEAFVGVWQGNDENGQPLFFMSLSSNGTGRKSNNLGAFADWVVFENTAQVAWTDGTYNELTPQSRTEALLKVWRKDTPRDQDPDASFTIQMVQDDTSAVLEEEGGNPPGS